MKEQSVLVCGLRASVALLWIRLMLVFSRDPISREAWKSQARDIMNNLTLRLNQ